MKQFVQKVGIVIGIIFLLVAMLLIVNPLRRPTSMVKSYIFRQTPINSDVAFVENKIEEMGWESDGLSEARIGRIGSGQAN